MKSALGSFLTNYHLRLCPIVPACTHMTVVSWSKSRGGCEALKGKSVAGWKVQNGPKVGFSGYLALSQRMLWLKFFRQNGPRNPLAPRHHSHNLELFAARFLCPPFSCTITRLCLIISPSYFPFLSFSFFSIVLCSFICNYSLDV